MSEEARSPDGWNGSRQYKREYPRSERGRFARGNPGGVGNPFARRNAEIQRAFREAVSYEDVIAAAKVVVRKARGGNLLAAMELLRRAGIKPVAVEGPSNRESVKPRPLFRMKPITS